MLLIIISVLQDGQKFLIQCANGDTFTVQNMIPHYNPEQPGMIAVWDRKKGIVFRNLEHEKACKQEWGIAA
jgi:hypothetical protein